MRFVAVDWGTSRFRALLVEGETIDDHVSSDEGISRLKADDHATIFMRHCGAWLDREPRLPVIVAGMAGSREGWSEAPYAPCPAGIDEIAASLLPVTLPTGGSAHIVPGLRCDAAGGVDVMRGEETHLIGASVPDGLICLPGTHCKWALMQDGRVERFATFMAGELYGLLREHSMIGRPATDPPDPSGFSRGLDAAGDPNLAKGGLLNQIFAARAATLTGRLSPDQLGPYLSGLLTGEEIAGALRLFGRPDTVTIVADPPRADLHVEALSRLGIGSRVVSQATTLVAGLARILAARSK